MRSARPRCTSSIFCSPRGVSPMRRTRPFRPQHPPHSTNRAGGKALVACPGVWSTELKNSARPHGMHKDA
jgi:hypothetical protein